MVCSVPLNSLMNATVLALKKSPIHNFFVLKLTNNATQTSAAGLPTGTKLANIQHMILLVVIDLIPIFLENKTMLFDL